MLPTRLSSFALMLASMAAFSSGPFRFLKSLSARYFSFSSLGVPTSPAVNAGERQYYEKHLERMAKYENLYLDLSGTGLFRYGMLAYGAKKVGAERFLFGTNSNTPLSAVLKGFDSLWILPGVGGPV